MTHQQQLLGVLVTSNFLPYIFGRRCRQESIGGQQRILRSKAIRRQFSGLESTFVRARQDDRWQDFQFTGKAQHITQFFLTFLGERPLRIRPSCLFGDTVSQDVDFHAV